MGRRSLNSTALIAGAFTLLFPLAGASFPSVSTEPPPRVGSAGGSGAQTETQVLIEWVLRSKDLATCVTAAPNLRRALFQHSQRVRVVAYAVDVDTAVVRSYLRRERLFRVEVKRISEGEFQREFARRVAGEAVTPMLIMVAPGSAREIPPTPNNWLVADREGSAELLARLEAFFRTAAVHNRSPHPSTTTRGGEK